MNLRDILQKICAEYSTAVTEPFGGHPLASFIRNEPGKVLAPFLTDDLVVLGSPGKGNWAGVPWIVIYNKNETDGPQEGLYVDYLFSSDFQRVYLALGHGVSRPIEREGKKQALDRIAAEIQEIRVNYPLKLDGFVADNKLSLSKTGLGANYEHTTVYYREYHCAELVDNDALVRDLQGLLAFYQHYLLESSVLTVETDFSGSASVEEGKRILKQHYVRERNPSIIKKAKQLAISKNERLNCEICGFSFQERYGSRGKDYIEGHHRKPVSEMQEGDVTRVEDIALICSNCHRMIHAKDPWLSIEEMRGILE